MASHGYGRTQCSALNCKISRYSKPRISFFRFPKDTERCRCWVENARRLELLNRTSEDLHASYHLCANHFELSQFMNEQRNKLIWCAIPTLFDISGLSYKSSTKCPHPIKLFPAVDQELQTTQTANSAESSSLTLQHITDNDSGIAHPPALRSILLPANARPSLPKTYSRCNEAPNATLQVLSTQNKKENDRGTINKRIASLKSAAASVLKIHIPFKTLAQTKVSLPFKKTAPHKNSTKCCCVCSNRSGRASSTLQTRFKEARRNLRSSHTCIRRLRLKIQKLTNRKQRTSLKEMSNDLKLFLSDGTYDFVLAQLYAASGKKRAIRWSSGIKDIILTVYRDSPRAYNMMTKVFELPSKKVLIQHEKEMKELLYLENELANEKVASDDETEAVDNGMEVVSDYQSEIMLDNGSAELDIMCNVTCGAVNEEDVNNENLSVTFNKAQNRVLNQRKRKLQCKQKQGSCCMIGNITNVYSLVETDYDVPYSSDKRKLHS